MKKMTVFGAQMQVSKLSSFASEKYDELLLGFFSVMNNMTFFNVSGRVIRFGRFTSLSVRTAGSTSRSRIKCT